MTESYRARQVWSEDRPETLVVCCSDGRVHAQITEYVRHAVSERPDLFAVPGGPACIDPWTSSFDEARVFEQSMRLFAQAHDVHGVWLIAHEGCAYYSLKHPHVSSDEIHRLQERDLYNARKLLNLAYPHLNVRCIFAGLEGSEVVFTTLAEQRVASG